MKKIITIVLMCALFNLSITPAFSDTDAEKDRRQQRAVLAAIGVVALVGTIFMVSRMDDDFNSSYFSITGNTDKNNRLTFGLDFFDQSYYYTSFNGMDDFAPVLKVEYSW